MLSYFFVEVTVNSNWKVMRILSLLQSLVIVLQSRHVLLFYFIHFHLSCCLHES